MATASIVVSRGIDDHGNATGMSSDEETAMIREAVAIFVGRELIPLEPHYLKSKLPGSDHPELTVEQKQRLRTVSKDLGLWGLDATEESGGHDLPTRTIDAVTEGLGRPL